jgi:hypothetical protein
VARKPASFPTVSINVFTDRAAEYLRLAQQSASQALAAMEQLRQARKSEAGGGRSGTTMRLRACGFDRACRGQTF